MARNSLEADTQAFQALVDAKCDFTKEHVIDFLFLGDEKNLKIVRKTLEDGGFFVKEPQIAGQLLIHNKMILNLPLMQEFTALFEQLASATNTMYDGWGTTTKA